jgi:hypothetical protein
MRSKTSIFCFPYAVLLGKICPFLGLPSQMAVCKDNQATNCGDNPGSEMDGNHCRKQGWIHTTRMADIRQKKRGNAMGVLAACFDGQSNGSVGEKQQWSIDPQSSLICRGKVLDL